jgi:hypothetical protein
MILHHCQSQPTHGLDQLPSRVGSCPLCRAAESLCFCHNALRTPALLHAWSDDSSGFGPAQAAGTRQSVDFSSHPAVCSSPLVPFTPHPAGSCSFVQILPLHGLDRGLAMLATRILMSSSASCSWGRVCPPRRWDDMTESWVLLAGALLNALETSKCEILFLPLFARGFWQTIHQF